ncbi:ergot alkaloid biosynthesis protein [Pleomorphomonas sp. PLEO]|uniref:ergot alkaloid biosynthesis protein n=1 Tax=Pleomorphomonas sp. PLEO TaxID=3239306 RepID=UPI00351F2316
MAESSDIRTTGIRSSFYVPSVALTLSSRSWESPIMPNPAILVTGATGKTGRRVVECLVRMKLPARAGSRNPAPDGVHFDWSQSETWSAALDGVRAVYLVAPSGVTDVLGAMKPFIDQAVEVGVDRFVLLSASSLPEGGPMMGAVHAYLRQAAPHWTVLRPSWFMQNFSELQHQSTIKDERRIYSATADGRVGFIEVGDIASVAAHALADPAFPDAEYILTGPETMSYSEVAAVIGKVIGADVRYIRLLEAEVADRFRSIGIPDEYAKLLAAMDSTIADGAENRVTTKVADITGQPPRSFEAFAASAAAAWYP